MQVAPPDPFPVTKHTQKSRNTTQNRHLQNQQHKKTTLI